MRKLRTEKTAEVKEFRLRLEHLKTHKDQSTKLKSDVSEGQDKDRNYMVQINDLQEQAKVCLTMMHQVLWRSDPLHVQAFRADNHLSTIKNVAPTLSVRGVTGTNIVFRDDSWLHPAKQAVAGAGPWHPGPLHASVYFWCSRWCSD